MDKKILKEIREDNFPNFNRLDEAQKIEIMRSWNREQWTKFCMQNTVPEKEVFDPILKLIDSE